MPAGPRGMLYTTSTAFALAAVACVTAHEISHYGASLLIGHSATLRPSAIDPHGTLSRAQQIVVTAAGPVMSLVYGWIVILFGGRWGRGFGRVFWTWFGLMSAQNFYGYLMIAGVFSVGDTAVVLDLLHAPRWVYLALFVVGLAGMLLNSWLFAVQAVRYCGLDRPELRLFGIFPWLIGTALVVLIYLVPDLALSSDAVVVSIVADVAIGIFAPMFTFFFARVTAPPREQLRPTTSPVPAVALVVIAVLWAVVRHGVL